MNIKSNKLNLIFLIFTFSSIYLTGLIVYQDYGLNIDDPYYRYNGNYFYNFVKVFLLGDISTSKFDFKNDINIPTPVLYEIIVSTICDILKISDSKKIYEVSHLTNFSIFFLSLIFLYNIIFKRFKNKLFSILSVLILFLSPRIFSESFYNSRDIFFLSMTVVSIFFAQNYFNKNSFKNLVYCSLFFAALFTSRILGFIPILILFILIFLMNFDSKKISNITNWHFIIFGFFCLLFLILFNPYLWIDTFQNFIDYFSTLIKTQESINVVQLFLGEYSSSTNASWYYRPIWFLITTPTSIIIFLIPGLYICSSRFILRIINLTEDKKNIWKGRNELLDVFIFLSLLISVYLSCRFNSNQFGGWRHLYFIYPFIIYFVIYGINYSYRILRKTIIINVITFLIFLNLVYCLIWIKTNHPYQYVFFNYVSNKIVKNNFDLDYWGLSNLNSLNYILQKDKRELIKVGTLSFSSLEPSVIMLNRKDKKRILVSYDLEKSDYLLSNHMQRIRHKTKKYLINYNKFYEISVNNHIINTVYKRK